MKKRRITALALASVLALSMSTTVFAKEITEDGTTAGQSKNERVTVEFSVLPTYSVTIPSNITLSPVKEGETVVGYASAEDITCSAVRMNQGDYLKVTLSGDFELQSAEGAKLDYIVKVNDSTNTLTTGGEAAAFATNSSPYKSTLHFTANNPGFAGLYQDQVTFGIGITTGTADGDAVAVPVAPEAL